MNEKKKLFILFCICTGIDGKINVKQKQMEKAKTTNHRKINKPVEKSKVVGLKKTPNKTEKILPKKETKKEKSKEQTKIIEKPEIKEIPEQDPLHNEIVKDSQYILEDEVRDGEEAKEVITHPEIDVDDEDEIPEKPITPIMTSDTKNQKEDEDPETEDIVDDNNFYSVFLLNLIMTCKEKPEGTEEAKLAMDDFYNSLATLSTVDTFFLFLFTILKNHGDIRIRSGKVYLQNTLLLEFIDKNIYFYQEETKRQYLLILTEERYELLKEFLSFFANVFQNPREDNIFYLLSDLCQEVNIKNFIGNKEKIHVVLPVKISKSDPNLEKIKLLRKKKKIIPKQKKGKKLPHTTKLIKKK